MKEAKDLFHRAYELWNSGDAKLDRHNRKAWVRSVLRLGDKWLLAKPVARLDKK
jgi:hypothetical protein